MQTVSIDPDVRKFIRQGLNVIFQNLCAINQALDSAQRIEDAPSRNKPLAQGKPARSRAASKPAARRRKARKSSKPK